MIIPIADLFCGAGGTSTGAVQAIEALGGRADLTAINHWSLAVGTHSLNHPEARHLCVSIDSVNPRDLYKEKELEILWASPECTHHSIARGGRPVSDQSRATAWCVVRWAEALQPRHIMVENVPEFLNWAPIGSDGQPLKSKKGEVFNAWIKALEACGYRMDWKILRASDYGDPTTRRRLFVQGVRGRKAIVWPNPTHGDPGELSNLHPFRTAREIINWDLHSESIFERKRPLAKKTLERIEEGLWKYGLAPFLVPQQSRHKHRTLDKPLQTITAHGTGEGLVQPYIVAWDNQSGSGVWKIDQPLTTVCTKGRHGLAEPFLISLRGTSDSQIKASARSVDKPVPTLTAGGGHLGLAQPYLVNYYGNGRSLSVDEPLDTVTTKQRFGLCMPTVEIDGEMYKVDIRYRMLQPEELAAATGFPDDYLFKGTKTQVVKQIGNAVPCGLARALVLAALTQNNDISRFAEPVAKSA